MLSKEERQEMIEMAKSETIHQEFRMLRHSSQINWDNPIDINQLMKFLTTMSMLNPQTSRKQGFIDDSKFKL